jgi:hypothetical protein
MCLDEPFVLPDPTTNYGGDKNLVLTYREQRLARLSSDQKQTLLKTYARAEAEFNAMPDICFRHGPMFQPSS